MGTNNLETRSTGQVVRDVDVNQYKEALGNDVVPRNSSGVPTDEGGNIGTSTFRWFRVFSKEFWIGTPANAIKIIEESGAMAFQVGGVTRMKIDSGGFDGSFLKTGSVALTKRTAANVAKSGDINTNITGTTETAFTGASVSITTNGRPVMIFLEPSSNTAPAQSSLESSRSSSSTDYWSEYIVRRGTTEIARMRLRLGTGAGSLLAIPPSALFLIDDNNGSGLASGSYTYTVRGVGSDASVTTQISNSKLVAVEML